MGRLSGHFRRFHPTLRSCRRISEAAGTGPPSISSSHRLSRKTGVVHPTLVDRSGDVVRPLAPVHVWLETVPPAPLRREDWRRCARAIVRSIHLSVENSNRELELDRRGSGAVFIGGNLHRSQRFTFASMLFVRGKPRLYAARFPVRVGSGKDTDNDRRRSLVGKRRFRRTGSNDRERCRGRGAEQCFSITATHDGVLWIAGETRRSEAQIVARDCATPAYFVTRSLRNDSGLEPTENIAFFRQ
jgi:hypothetical protein